MTADTDFRSNKMESLEGEGLARGRRHTFYERIDERVISAAEDGQRALAELPDEATEDLAESAVERAELAAFWMAWHLAGGFAGLQREGYDRSTIFRKVKRFRMVLGEHPDTYRFSWLKIDFAQAWDEEISRLVEHSSSFISPSKHVEEY